MIRKNFKKDYLSYLEELGSSKLEELHKLKSTRSKIEFKMLFAPQKLQFKKE